MNTIKNDIKYACDFTFLCLKTSSKILYDVCLRMYLKKFRGQNMRENNRKFSKSDSDL